MTATGRTRASRTGEEEDAALKRAAPEAAAVETPGVPAVPNLDSGPLEPDAWLALQQAIGNNAVGGLVARRKAGQPLPSKTRHEMETSFGGDFGQVQVHSGPEVDQAAQAMDAAAFTAGDDIFVSSAVPSFDKPLGRAVMGEELAHVAQGVGREGIGRITDPAEKTEREAHSAGLAVAAGENAHVNASHEAQGAVARWDFGALLGAAADAALAAAAPTDLKDDEKDRLAAGAMAPLNAYWTRLVNLEIDAKAGKHTAAEAKSIAISTLGLSDFILSFNGPPAVQSTIQAAAAATINGHQALIAASDPEAATKHSVGILASISNDVAALASGPQPAATPGATPAPGPTPAPGATPAPGTAPAPGSTPAPTPSADTLTAAEADQVKFGAVDPLKIASQQLDEEKPDLDNILIRLKGVSGVLKSFNKQPALAAKAMIVDGQIIRLEAARAGTQGALGMAISQWGTAITLLQGLTAKSPAGGAPPASPAPGAAGDDDKPKDNSQSVQ